MTTNREALTNKVREKTTYYYCTLKKGVELLCMGSYCVICVSVEHELTSMLATNQSPIDFAQLQRTYGLSSQPFFIIL